MSGQTGGISGGTLAEQVKPVLASAPIARTADFNTTGVDRQRFNVVEWEIPLGAMEASTTLDIKVQDSDDDSSYADLASSTQQVGAADPNVFRVSLPQQVAGAANTLLSFQTDLRKARKFARLAVTVGGGGGKSAVIGVVALLGANVEGYKV